MKLIRASDSSCPQCSTCSGAPYPWKLRHAMCLTSMKHPQLSSNSRNCKVQLAHASIRHAEDASLSSIMCVGCARRPAGFMLNRFQQLNIPILRPMARRRLRFRSVEDARVCASVFRQIHEGVMLIIILDGFKLLPAYPKISIRHSV